MFFATETRNPSTYATNEVMPNGTIEPMTYYLVNC